MLRSEKSEITPTKATLGRAYNSNDELYGGHHAIDKDLSTIAATHTDHGTGWLKLELDRTYLIEKVVIYYRFNTNWYDSLELCFNIFATCVAHNSNVDVSVYQGEVKQKSCGTLLLSSGLEQSDQIYTLVCNIGGDTVILSKSTYVIAVCEIVVIGTIIPGITYAYCYMWFQVLLKK